MKKKLLVTGANGMVGHYVKNAFADFDLIFSDITGDNKRLDVTDENMTMQFIGELKPHLVLHLAALTDVDRCQRDEGLAYKCNQSGTRNVALACKEIDAEMIYISSGSVFSGSLGRPAKETDIPDPVNTYGKSKLAGEAEVSSILRKYYIIRAGWMIGGGPDKDKKFVGKIMKKILDGEKHLKIINDKFGSPVYAKDLIAGLVALLQIDNSYGLYHMVNANEGESSRYDITVAIKDILKNDSLGIEPVSSDAFNLSAPRARSEALENCKLKKMKLEIMKPWQDALSRYLNEEWRIQKRLEKQCLK